MGEGSYLWRKVVLDLNGSQDSPIRVKGSCSEYKQLLCLLTYTQPGAREGWPVQLRWVSAPSKGKLAGADPPLACQSQGLPQIFLMEVYECMSCFVASTECLLWGKGWGCGSHQRSLMPERIG